MSSTLLNVQKTTPRLEVFTLGQFVAKCGDTVLSDDAGRSYRLWELFKYLVTHRGKGSLPEVIVETLWPEQDYEDPKAALRTLVYRLRQLLAKHSCASQGVQPITFSQGCYAWNTSLDYWLDVDEFEGLCSQARAAADLDAASAVDLYLQAAALYRGDYLPECSYCEWVIPIKHYYRRLYLQSVLELTALLMEAERYSEVLKVCEQAFLIEPYEEELHLRFVEALLETGKIKQARSHYEYATSMFYRELGIKPSPTMRDLYRRTQVENANIELDLTWIQESLGEKSEAQGAFFCDPDVFRFLYKLEKRRAERSGQAVFLGLMTLTRPDYGLPAAPVLKSAMERLREHLQANLRKGDVVTCWNEAQFLIILPGLNLEQAEKVLGRIEKQFREKYRTEDVALRPKVQSLLPA